MRVSAIRVGLTLAILATGVACSSSGNGGTNPMGGHSSTINIVASSGGYGSTSYYFNPSPDTVAKGTAVTFTFGGVTHNVHFDTNPGAVDSIPSSSNTNVMRTFGTAGTYNYHCSIHNFSGVMVAQ